MIDLGNGNSIDGYSKINVILGKNGSGKSTLLRLMDGRLSQSDACIRYITPERGGELSYNGGIESTLVSRPNWLGESRRKNRWEQFRESSVTEFRNLERLVLLSIEQLALRSAKKGEVISVPDLGFDAVIDRINNLLQRVKLVRADTAGFSIVRNGDGTKAHVGELSSGEAELISLAIETLYFSHLCCQEKYQETDNWLLLDEPDVHLHPDLQHRLMQLLVTSLEGVNGRIAIATHSTSILASLCELAEDVCVGLKQFGHNALVFRSVDDATKSILPMFGAHPLSNVFNEKPPLIVEGEDDERIWQSAVRRSEGRISVFPCVAGNIQTMHRYESVAHDIIESVYDDAQAYSLRDRDDDLYEIEDLGKVIRSRLNCRNSENLIVTDDVLAELGTNWTTMQSSIEDWTLANTHHPRHDAACAFRDDGWDRRNAQLKELRLLLIDIAGSTKPWEVAVGKAIARLNENRFKGENSLENYLGPKIVQALKLLA